MRKKIMAALIAGALSACAIAGCTVVPVKSIESIEKTATDGLVDTYTITYTDGSTSTYTVTNGKDGLDSGVSVSSIEKDHSVGNVDYYKITYTDANKQPTYFTVTNGQDGQDAPEITVEDVYEAYKQKTGDNVSFEQFCNQYLSVKNNYEEQINNCLLSSMTVYTVFTTTTTRPLATSYSMLGGSAVIYKMEDEYSYILTNYHVVYSKGTNETISNDIHAFMYGGANSYTGNTSAGYTFAEGAVTCQYVGGAIEYDVAVLRAKTQDILAANPQAKAVTLANDYAVGEKVFAIGNTEGQGIGVTQGIISVDREQITLSIDGTARKYMSLRTDAMIYNGNSGGGLFNTSGKMVGLNHAGDSEVEFMNNAIPVQTVKAVADGILYYAGLGHSATGTSKFLLGVTVTSENSRFVYDSGTGTGKITEDITVVSVVEGSTAQALAFAEGDIIKAVIVNGVEHPIYRNYHLGDLFLTVRVGDTLAFKYSRGGSVQTTATHTVTSANMNSVS